MVAALQRTIWETAPLWLGCDPGHKSGAMAVIDGQSFVDILPLEKATEQEQLDWALMHAPRIRLAMLEQVSARPGQGIASAFKFGGSYYGLRMLLTALRVPFRLVTPPKWQRVMQCLSGGDKKVTRSAAQRLFPKVKRITDKTADALLLADYARRQP